MRLIVALLATCLLAVLAGCSTAPEKAGAVPFASVKPRSDPADEAVLAEAAQHVREGRLTEASAIYERELVRHPESAKVMAGYANSLHEQGRREADPEKQRRLLLRARGLAERAEQLGTDDPLTPLILSTVSADGRVIEPQKGAFSSTAAVDELMQKGEAAFGRRDLDAALGFYRKAYELQPNNYSASLYIGDVYFSQKHYAEAREWFGRAVALDPNRETAHRYLGDALLQLGLRNEALNEWIDALICEPYVRLTRQHFRPEMRAAAEKAGFVVPRFPAMRSQFKEGEVQLHVDPDDGMLMLSYNLSAVAWRQADFAKTYPNEPKARRSLPEEVMAIDAMVEIATNAADDPETAKDLKKWETVVNALRKLKADGLLEAFILLDRPDEDIAKDYGAYREQHRDALRTYVRRYWCGLAK